MQNSVRLKIRGINKNAKIDRLRNLHKKSLQKFTNTTFTDMNPNMKV